MNKESCLKILLEDRKQMKQMMKQNFTRELDSLINLLEKIEKNRQRKEQRLDNKINNKTNENEETKNSKMEEQKTNPVSVTPEVTAVPKATCGGLSLPEITPPLHQSQDGGTWTVAAVTPSTPSKTSTRPTANTDLSTGNQGSPEMCHTMTTTTHTHMGEMSLVAPPANSLWQTRQQHPSPELVPLLSPSPSTSKDSDVSFLNLKGPVDATVMDKLLNSGNVQHQQCVARVIRLLREEFTPKGYMENGVKDLEMAEYIMSLANLHLDTFSNAITEKYSDLYWHDDLLCNLSEAVNGHTPVLTRMEKSFTPNTVKSDDIGVSYQDNYNDSPFKLVNLHDGPEGGAPGVTVRQQWASGNDKTSQMRDQNQSHTRPKWLNYRRNMEPSKNLEFEPSHSTLSNATYLWNSSAEDDSCRYSVVDINIDSTQSQENTSALAISTPLYVKTLATVTPITVNAVIPLTASTMTNITPLTMTSMETVESLEHISIATEVPPAARSSITEDAFGPVSLTTESSTAASPTVTQASPSADRGKPRMIYINSRSPDVAENLSADNLPDLFPVSHSALAQEWTSVVSEASFKSKSLQNMAVHYSHASSESFKSPPKLTVQMTQTKQFTNIIRADPQSNVLKPNKFPQNCSECLEDQESLLQRQEKTGHLNLKCESVDQLYLEITPPRPTNALNDRDNSGSMTTLRSNSNGSIMHLGSLNDKPDVHEEDSHESSFSSHSIHESRQMWCEKCNAQIRTENLVKHVRQCVTNIRSRSHSQLKKKYKDYLHDDFHMRKEHKTAYRSVQSSNLYASSLVARNVIAAHPQLPSKPPEKPQQMDSLSRVGREEMYTQLNNSSHWYRNNYQPPSIYETPSSQTSTGVLGTKI